MWVRPEGTLEVWEQLNNPAFNSLEFEGIRNEAGRNSFFLSAKKWIEATGAVGIYAKAACYGGTYAHKDIAFEFGSWLNPEFNPPHFHVQYEGFRAIVGIDRLELREGSLPPRVLGLVMEWAELHQAELRENCTTLAAEGNFTRIAPLV